MSDRCLILFHERERMRCVVGVLALALVGGGCSALTGTESGPKVLSTDRGVYVAEAVAGTANPTFYEFTVRVRTENHSVASLELERCGPTASSPIYAITLVDGQSPDGSAYDLAWGCPGPYPPLVVAPGATRDDTIHFQGPTVTAHGSGEPRGAFTGRMRIVFYTPRGEVRSNVFVVSLRN